MDDILIVNGLSAGYGRQIVVQDISFSIRPGEILGIVGESGCGKSTLLKAVMQQRQSGVRTMAGQVVFAGRPLEELSHGELRQIRGTELGMIFQNPAMSFNAIRTYRSQFYETMKSHGRFVRGVAEREILAIFSRLKLGDGRAILDSRPYEMSGGMNQRIAIAMAMLLKPKLLLADEPTSALDVTVQRQVVEELLKLRSDCGTAMILVTHHIGVVRKMADRIAILYAGRIVEYGDCHAVLAKPEHPYTQALLQAVPTLHGPPPQGLDGNPPAQGAEDEACVFSGRCPYRNERCCLQASGLREVGPGHWSNCSASGRHFQGGTA